MKNYERSYQRWLGFLDGKVTKNLCHKTTVNLERNMDINITYWYTPIVTINFKTQNLKLNTGKYYTLTTKRRLNQLTPPGFYIYQKDFKWFAQDVTGVTKVFEDYMEINRNGYFI